jgi:hypothetical protein
MIEKQNMFHSPESWEDLLQWILLHPKSDQVHILTGAMMAWNLACDTVQQSEKENQND